MTTSGGTANTIAMFTTATNIQNSILTQTGTTAVNVGGKLNLPAMGTASASAGFNSRPEAFVASVFNSGTSTSVPRTFQWQAEPVNNDKPIASGLLSLLYATGTATPSETGLKINNKGVFTFAAGQTFPGVVTSVTAGTGLAGGTITKTGTISILSGGVTNAMLQKSSLAVVEGTDLKGGGAVSLGGTTTLNLDTTKVPTLAAANAFTNSNSFTGTPSSPEVNVTNNGTGDGIDVFSKASDGVFSETDGFDGGDFISFGSGYGSFAESVADANFETAAAGWQFGASKEDIGVWGFAGSTLGIGNYAEGFSASTEGTNCCAGLYSIGLWADTSGKSGSSAGIAALTTVDNGYSLVSYSNSANSTVRAENDVSGNSSAPVFVATGTSGSCVITVSGDLTCTGTVTPAVPVNGGAKKVALYGMQSAKNWFEDAGSGQLSNGSAMVHLENTFAETVNTGVEYHVFLTPNGDSKGLYVTQKSPFEVHELGGGTSNVAFDYRIMAKRRGYEKVRLADMTKALQIQGPNRRPAGLPRLNPDDVRKAHRQEVEGLRNVATTGAANVNPVQR